MTTAPALTYGDTFTLPSITNPVTGEPVLFRIDDVRDIEHAGDMYEDRARFTAITANGDRIPTTHAVKIGRTERSAASLLGFGARWASSRLEVSTFSSTLTDKMNDAVRADADALTFDLPGYTVPELRAALIEAAGDLGKSLGRLHGYAERGPWDGYRQHAPARALLAEAMDKETRQAMHDAMTAAFEAQTAEALKVFA